MNNEYPFDDTMDKRDKRDERNTLLSQIRMVFRTSFSSWALAIKQVIDGRTMDEWKDGWTDGQMDGRNDEGKDGQTEGRLLVRVKE